MTRPMGPAPPLAGRRIAGMGAGESLGVFECSAVSAAKPGDRRSSGIGVKRLPGGGALCQPLPRRLRLFDRRHAQRGLGAHPAGQRPSRPARRAAATDLAARAVPAGDPVVRYQRRLEIFIIALAASFPVILNTFAGVRSIDANLFRASRSLGASEFEIEWGVGKPAQMAVDRGGLNRGRHVLPSQALRAHRISADR